MSMMKMTIQTPDIKAPTSLLDFVLDKVGKLGAFSERILECRVQLKVDGSREQDNKVSELKLLIPGSEVFASCQGTTFEEAILQAIEAIKPQVERWKSAKRGKFYASFTPLRA